MMSIDLQDPQTNLIEKMTYRSEVPFYAERVNDNFIIGIYQGKKGDFDMIIRYRQIENDTLSDFRTPKHIHWVVDILFKMKGNQELTQRFIEKLLKMRDSIEAITSPEQRTERLNLPYLLNDFEEYGEFQSLDEYGEYSIQILLVLVKLFLIQEKTNYPNGKMLKKCLETLKNPRSIFTAISKATYH